MDIIKSTQQTSLSRAVFRARLEALRELMKARGMDAYLIVTDDFHASEYVGDYFKCRAYISGFTGSAGTLVVTADEAGLWTDGRYFLQARDQLDGTGIILMKMGEKGVPAIPDYLADKLPAGACLGFDGRTVNAAYADRLKKSLEKKHVTFSDKEDLVDLLWQDRPAFPEGKIWLLDDKYSGKSRKDKLDELRDKMKEAGAEYHLLASLDDIAWLYNFRGEDIAYTPVALSYTLVGPEETVLYIGSRAVEPETAMALMWDGIEIRPYLEIYDDLGKLPAGSSLLLDKGSVNVALVHAVADHVKLIHQTNPTLAAKARKNPVEMENIRKAHIKDGLAVTRLIFWLKQEMKKSPLPRITELSVCRKLEEFRKQGEDYLGQSFSPISAYGEHGAIVHYDPENGEDIPLKPESFLLLDTGGQYLQGTTDITRTISLGPLSQEQKRNYTAVLRGNLNLGAARFMHGCTGLNLDYLAREPLWELGLDYNHGTGHGVGYLLNVHEGPNGIRLKERDGSTGAVFEEGMLTSDEPGIYLEGRYGIRIENLMMCRKAEKTEYGQFMRFETMTMVPYDRQAIDPELMSERELARLNVYHARVYDTLAPYLDRMERTWLLEETKPF